MSQPPDWIPPLPPQMTPLPYYGTVATLKLPAGPKALAIIAIVLGSLGVMGICAAPMYLTNVVPNPAMDAIRNNKSLLSLTVGSALVNAAVGAILLMAAIRCLNLKPSGRPMLVLAASIMIASHIVAPITNYFITRPIYRDLAAQHPNDPIFQSMAGNGKFSFIIHAIGAVVGLLFIAYYIIVIRVFTSAKTKELFALANAAPAPFNPPSP